MLRDVEYDEKAGIKRKEKKGTDKMASIRLRTEDLHMGVELLRKSVITMSYVLHSKR